MTPPRNSTSIPEQDNEQFNRIFDVVTYISLVAGYVLAITTAEHVTFPNFLLFTAGNIVWLLLYHRLNAVCDTNQRVLFGIMIAVALLTTASIGLGLGYDWLLAIVTCGYITNRLPFKQAALVTAGMYVGAMLDLAIGIGGFSANFWGNCASIAPAFLFVLCFSYMSRQQRQQREHTGQLLTELTQKTADLEAAHTELRAYANQVEELATIRERNRMAREIHDTLGHYLTILAVQLETATKLEARGDPRLPAELSEARRVTAECLAEVRRSVAALRPADLTATSFIDALHRLVTEFEAICPEVTVTADCEGPAQELPTEMRVTIYRAAQEALTNIRKHAQATKVLVRLRVDTHHAELTVLDNGLGATANSDGHAPGFGLLGMGERVALLGGTATSQPAPTQGWRVEVIIPCGQAAPTILQQARAIVNAVPEE